MNNIDIESILNSLKPAAAEIVELPPTDTPTNGELRDAVARKIMALVSTPTVTDAAAKHLEVLNDLLVTLSFQPGD